MEIATLQKELAESQGRREQDMIELATIFNEIQPTPIKVDHRMATKLARLAGTTALEAMYILQAIERTKHIPGDWCEYGVAHGRTSALLAEAILDHTSRKLWLYDSFEGLPAPHEKDVLLNDIYGFGSAAAYKGFLAFPEEIVRSEVRNTGLVDSRVEIKKGWITKEFLRDNSPKQIAFAYLDMDFYQSTYDVLELLTERMPINGIAVLDDYGFFSEGVKTAFNDVMAKTPYFTIDVPFNSKFAVIARIGKP